MRILTVSDYVVPELSDHFDTERFQGVDMVLACGDLPPEYLAGLAARFKENLYFVRGNHDIRADRYPPAGCVDLHGQVLRIAGLTLLGLEGSHWYNGGPHQYTEAEMRKLVRRLKSPLRRWAPLDIIFTHSPPRHIHDGEDPCHRGFDCFRKLIHQYAPRYFIHGHIHRHFTDPAERTTILRDTHVINTYGYHLLDITPLSPLGSALSHN